MGMIVDKFGTVSSECETRCRHDFVHHARRRRDDARRCCTQFVGHGRRADAIRSRASGVFGRCHRADTM